MGSKAMIDQTSDPASDQAPAGNAKPARAVVRPLHKLFGVDVTVSDVAACRGDAIAEIDRLVGLSGLVLIRDADLDEPGLADFAARFGTLQQLGQAGKGPPGIFRLTNMTEDGAVRPQDDASRRRHDANKLWHTDSSFMAPGASYSFLHALVVPEGGKDTLFCDMRAAWEALDAPRRATLLPLVALHSMEHSWRLSGMAEPPLTGSPPVARKLVRPHAPSGRRALVIPSHVARIEGRDDLWTRDTLAELTAIAAAPERVYRHRWRRGDLLIWDNRCMLHRASRSGAEDQPRDMITCRLSDIGDDGLAVL